MISSFFTKTEHLSKVLDTVGCCQNELAVDLKMFSLENIWLSIFILLGTDQSPATPPVIFLAINQNHPGHWHPSWVTSDDPGRRVQLCLLFLAAALFFLLELLLTFLTFLHGGAELVQTFPQQVSLVVLTTLSLTVEIRVCGGRFYVGFTVGWRGWEG